MDGPHPHQCHISSGQPRSFQWTNTLKFPGDGRLPAVAQTDVSTAPSLSGGECAPAAAPAQRLASLDAFRGFTMFWIVGGKALLIALGALPAGVVVGAIKYELTHSTWEGLRYYDLIWPSFMLMVGVSIPYSFAKRGTADSDAGTESLRSALQRAAVLFLLGSLRTSLSNNTPTWVELSSALQPIALAYLVASLLAGCRPRTQAAVGALILVGYGLLLAFVPAPNVAAVKLWQGSSIWWRTWTGWCSGAPRGSTQTPRSGRRLGTVLSAIPIGGNDDPRDADR